MGIAGFILIKIFHEIILKNDGYMDLICGELDRDGFAALNKMIIEPISKSGGSAPTGPAIRCITLNCDGEDFLNTSKTNKANKVSEIDESIKTFLKLCNKNVEWLIIEHRDQFYGDDDDGGTENDQGIISVIEFLKSYFTNKADKIPIKNNNNKEFFASLKVLQINNKRLNLKMNTINGILKNQLDVFGKCGIAFLFDTQGRLDFDNNNNHADQDSQFDTFFTIVCSLLSSQIPIDIKVCFKNFTSVHETICRNYLDKKKLVKEFEGKQPKVNKYCSALEQPRVSWFTDADDKKLNVCVSNVRATKDFGDKLPAPLL